MASCVLPLLRVGRHRSSAADAIASRRAKRVCARVGGSRRAKVLGRRRFCDASGRAVPVGFVVKNDEDDCPPEGYQGEATSSIHGIRPILSLIWAAGSNAADGWSLAGGRDGAEGRPSLPRSRVCFPGRAPRVGAAFRREHLVAAEKP